MQNIIVEMIIDVCRTTGIFHVILQFDEIRNIMERIELCASFP